MGLFQMLTRNAFVQKVKLACGLSILSVSRAIPLLIKNFNNSAAVERRVCMMRSRIPVVIEPLLSRS